MHNPLYSNSFPSLYSHELFDLIEAYRNPTYSYLQNNIINRYIHTVSEYTGKDGVANMSLSIYAYSTCRFWSKESVAVGDTIKLSNYEHVEFSFNSFSKDYFRKQIVIYIKYFLKLLLRVIRLLWIKIRSLKKTSSKTIHFSVLQV
ncbi:glycosyltransferase sugar-binding region containing DXD motif family protein [Escherichia coli]|nr:glycosyltransferase sugar-binding region containing DXD motif family protein [Escherichia coli]